MKIWMGLYFCLFYLFKFCFCKTMCRNYRNGQKVFYSMNIGHFYAPGQGNFLYVRVSEVSGTQIEHIHRHSNARSRTQTKNFGSVKVMVCRSQWPRGLRRRSAVARLLKLRVRISPGIWMSFCLGYCVLLGRFLCVGLITRPDESYLLWCFVVCDLETSRMRRSWPTNGLLGQKRLWLYFIEP